MPSRPRSLEDICVAVRWTEADARIAVDEFRSSGLSAREFSARYGLHPLRLQRWAARLGMTPARGATSMVVAPVHIAAIPVPLVEVVLGARVLRIPASLDEEQVVRLVRAVETA